MKKFQNESELVKKALHVGAVYAKKRGYGEVESHDSVKIKVEFIDLLFGFGFKLDNS